MTDPVRVGIIGGGNIAKAHVLGLRAVPSFFGSSGLRSDVVVIADKDIETAAEAADALQIPQWTDDWQAMVARDDIDLITIAAPNHLHAEMARAVAAAGKHVMCEKPLAMDGAEADAMVAAVTSAGVVDSLNLTYRQVPALRYAVDLVTRGELGEIRSVRSTWLQDWGLDDQVPRSWKFLHSTSGGGPLLSLGCHVIDLCHLLVGPVEAVVAATTTAIGYRPAPGGRDTYAASGAPDDEALPVDVEDTGTILLRFANRAIGTLETSRIAPGRKNHFSLELDGSHGALAFNYERPNEIHVGGGRSSGLERVVVGPEQDGGTLWPLGGMGVGFSDLMACHMYDLLRGISEGRPLGPTFRDGARTQHVIDAAIASTRSHSWEPPSPAYREL